MFLYWSCTWVKSQVQVMSWVELSHRKLNNSSQISWCISLYCSLILFTWKRFYLHKFVCKKHIKWKWQCAQCTVMKWVVAVFVLLANVNSSSCSLYVIVRPSICLSVCLTVICHLSSVTFVHPTQAIEIFGNVSMPCGTLAISDLCVKILRRSSQGNPFVGGGLNPRGVAKYSDFRLFEGYISETVQDRR